MEVMLFPYTPLSCYILASHYKVDTQEVLDKWLEKQQVHDPEGWRLLDGIPCIVGGFTALLGKCQSDHSIGQLNILQGPSKDEGETSHGRHYLPLFMSSSSC
jgi:hypothetical protein